MIKPSWTVLVYIYNCTPLELPSSFYDYRNRSERLLRLFFADLEVEFVISCECLKFHG